MSNTSVVARRTPFLFVGLSIVIGIVCLSACIFDESRLGLLRCDPAQNSPCKDGGECVDGFCVPPACGSTCYTGPEGTAGVGACQTGIWVCEGASPSCDGEQVPSPEICNGIDDDCDGKTDEDLAPSDCVLPSEVGICAQGTTECREGVPVCIGRQPEPETCNGQDDDCNEVIDDIPRSVCFEAAQGCDLDAQPPVCVGICKLGVQTCDACEGQVLPRAESENCFNGVDDDCDGTIDNDCPCTTGQYCFPGTLDACDITTGVCHGSCQVGEQTCEDGKLGACTGYVLPTEETCDNPGVDDDCNGLVDDIPGLGDTCFVPSQMGVCAQGVNACVDGQVTCVTPEPAPDDASCNHRDDDCDGLVDEDINFESKTYCGSCEQSCTGSTTCCGGTCVNTAISNAHCGKCNVPCNSILGCLAGICL